MIGSRFKSTQDIWYTVIEKIPHPKGARWKIQFDETNGRKYITVTEKKHVLSGGIKNPYYNSKLGIACIGNVNSKKYPKEFNKWRAMIGRCYDKNNNHYKSYGDKGVTVCERWLCFENFLEDLPKLKGYDYDKLQNGELQLDKDIEGSGVLYSPENCVLVSGIENMKEMNQRVKQRAYKAIHMKDGHEIIFDNQIEFAKNLGLNQANLSRHINGEQKSFGGYIIKPLEECIND